MLNILTERKKCFDTLENTWVEFNSVEKNIFEEGKKDWDDSKKDKETIKRNTKSTKVNKIKEKKNGKS